MRREPWPIDLALNGVASPTVVATPAAAGVFAPIEINGRWARSKFGRALGVGSIPVTIWGGVSRYVYPTAATVMSISSTSADDAVGGLGATSIVIIGLDANYELNVELVELNGQTPVSTAVAWLRIPRMFCVTPGSSGLDENAGTIWAGTGIVTAGVPAVKHALIEPMKGQTLMALDTVPDRKRLILTSINLGVSAQKSLDVDLFVRNPGESWRSRQNYQITPGWVPRRFDFPIVIEQRADIEFRGSVPVASADVSASFDGYWEDM